MTETREDTSARVTVLAIAALALCVLGTMVAGCGGTARVTKAQARAFARAVNLRDSDLPDAQPNVDS
jgi:hypothetical protein